MHDDFNCFFLWWPTIVTAEPKTSRQKQKHHSKTKNLMQNQKPHAKPKTSRQKQKTSRQNQVLHSKSKIALVLPWVFAFAMRYFRVSCFWSEAFGFAVRSLVLPWGFCFCREVFGFAVMFLFLPWGFGFALTVVGHRSFFNSCEIWYLFFQAPVRNCLWCYYR